mgnify:CR=1 FL=1
MAVCNIKWLKAVDGNPVGRVVTGVERDELVDKWEQMGLVEVIPVDAPDEKAVDAPESRETVPLAAGEAGLGFGPEEPSVLDTKAVWRGFLDSRDIPYRRGATKNELIRAWEERDDG